jgi:hypothetical protein
MSSHMLVSNGGLQRRFRTNPKAVSEEKPFEREKENYMENVWGEMFLVHVHFPHKV